MTTTTDTLISELQRLYQTYGDQQYGEQCTQYEHMAQCAWWAEQKGYSRSLIIAAFLHDIGHLLADDQQLVGRDRWGYAQHDILGASWLREHGFPESVCAPIAMHVEAKRYLVATDADYACNLSKASKATLAQQGGPFSYRECQSFAASRNFEDAIRLRQLDELGKAEQFMLPPLQEWLNKVRAFLAISLDKAEVAEVRS